MGLPKMSDGENEKQATPEEEQEPEHKSIGEEIESEKEELSAGYGEVDVRSYDSDLESFEDDIFSNIAPSISRAGQEEDRDFFEALGRIPDIDDISLSASLKLEIAQWQKEQLGETELDAEVSFIELKAEEEEEDQKQTSKEAFSIEAEEEESTEISSLDFDFEAEDEAEQQLAPSQAAAAVSDENLFEALAKGSKEAVVVIEKPDLELLARLEEVRLVKKGTRDFLRAIIDAVVQKYEEQRAVRTLRENLDKVKLFKKLTRLISEINTEVRVNTFLDKQCVTYYRRQKVLWPINADKQVTQTEYDKYLAVLDDLNAKLGREAATKQITAKKLQENEVLASELEIKLKREIAALETLVKKSFNPWSDPQLALFIERRLAEMARLRQEISQVREKAISQQHVKASLQDDMNRLENITPTLHLRDYERMLIEEYELSKQLEEKTDRLERRRQQFNKTTHFIGHLREAQATLFHTVDGLRNILHAAETKKDELRAKLHSLRTNRLIVKNRIQEESINCGLVDKPVLLIDYDESAARLREVSAKVKSQRNQIESINKRISALEKDFSRK